MLATGLSALTSLGGGSGASKARSFSGKQQQDTFSPVNISTGSGGINDSQYPTETIGRGSNISFDASGLVVPTAFAFGAAFLFLIVKTFLRL